ncbi:MAG: hypothetical protein H7Y11_05315 [Armatimonadetes bacterium]|nr:hypothetical protein [Anaerolineae bacterium]
MKYATIRSAKPSGFAYTPPDSIYGVVRVLLVIGTVQPSILANMLRGLWRLTPLTRILVTDNDALAPTMLNENMRPVDLALLPMRPYASATGGRVIAPSLLAEVDACLTLTTAPAGDLSAPPSLGVLRALAATPTDIETAYHALGTYFAGGLVDAGETLFWGDDLQAVDAAVYAARGLAFPNLAPPGNPG